MRRRAIQLVVLGACTGAAVLTIAAAEDARHLAFTVDTRLSKLAAVIAPRQEACQRDVDVEARFDAVQLVYGTFHRPGPTLAVRVLDSPTGRTLATGHQPAGYPDNRPTATAVSPGVPAPGRVDVCVRNAGGRRVALWGGDASDAYPSRATVGDRPASGDLSLVLLRRHARTALSLVPTIFRRAALFHPSWVGSWTFWLLLAGVVLVMPALLCVAVGRAAQGSDPAATG